MSHTPQDTDTGHGPEQSSTDDNYKVRLDGVFEGPMDLLVHLIRKNEVDIYDIPIGIITDQYLAYIELMRAMNIDLAGDFLVMAATLAQIKSRMLLPVHDGQEDGEEQDPRTEITGPLLEYLQMKSAAEMLAQRNLLGHDTFVRKSDAEPYLADDSEEMIKVGLFELIDAFQRILANISPAEKVEMTADRISVKDRITEIVDVLEDKGSVAFNELFPAGADKGEIIITFLAILEMVKLRLIRLIQNTGTGAIRLYYL